jgi:signal transduction histidine kinase
MATKTTHMPTDIYRLRAVRLLLLVLGLTVLGLAAVLYFVRRNQAEAEALQQHSAEVLRLSERVIYFDEVLTMSAKMYAAQGDARWQSRYQQHVPQLDSALAQLKRLAPNTFEMGFVQQTNVANQALIAMEGHAFDLAKGGRLAEAIATLDSPEYELQKKIYSDNMLLLRQQLQAGSDRLHQAHHQRITWLIAAIFVLLPALALAYWFTFRLLKNYLRHKAQLERAILAQSRALKELNEEIKQHNEEIRVQNAVLDEQSRDLAQMNATKNKLFSVIAHDLRSPFNELKGILFLLDLDSVTKEEMHTMVGEVKTRLGVLDQMLTDLLQWAKSQMSGASTLPQVIDLHGLVDQKIDLLAKVAAAKSIALANTVPPEITVHADPNQLRAILRNLMSNALKFTPAQGEVRIEATPGRDLVTVAVTDTGLGMAPDQLASLFANHLPATTRGTAGEEGTGLGLLLCKDFVEQNGGSIWATSQPGQGSTFYFTLLRA